MRKVCNLGVEMNFFEAIGAAFRNYASFGGVAKRAEYWYFILFIALVYAALFVIAIATGVVGLVVSLFLGFGGADSGAVASSAGASFASLLILTIITGLFAVATLLPFLAIHVRRMRDAGLNWWMIVLLFILAFFTFYAVLLIACAFPSREKQFLADQAQPESEPFSVESNSPESSRAKADPSFDPFA